MTSANLSEEPLAYRNERGAGAARQHRRSVSHARPRYRSTVRRLCGARDRGSADGAAARARLCAQIDRRDDTISIRPSWPAALCSRTRSASVIGDAAYLGPHIGDLENLETYQSFQESIARMERFLRVAPEIIAHDMHPDYMSTAYALARPERTKIAVQHHHAHIVSAMAEHALTGPVIGVAYDGTGYGTDGTAWGGEVMVVRYDGFERIATLRGIRLAGGDAAIRHPWRIALALVEDAFDGRPPLDSLPLLCRDPGAGSGGRPPDDRRGSSFPDCARRRALLRRDRLTGARTAGRAVRRTDRNGMERHRRAVGAATVRPRDRLAAVTVDDRPAADGPRRRAGCARRSRGARSSPHASTTRS